MFSFLLFVPSQFDPLFGQLKLSNISQNARQFTDWRVFYFFLNLAALRPSVFVLNVRGEIRGHWIDRRRPQFVARRPPFADRLGASGVPAAGTIPRPFWFADRGKYLKVFAFRFVWSGS